MTAIPPDPRHAAILELCMAIARGDALPDAWGVGVDEPRSLQQTIDWHALGPALHLLVQRRGAAPLSATMAEACRRQYLAGIAQRMLAVRQLEEIARAFGEHRIELIALKGAAALLWLYDPAECRPVQDLDLLVRREAVPRVRRAMESLGYAPLANRSSDTEEELLLGRTHMRPYLRPASLPVEFHVTILQGRGAAHVTTADLFTEAVESPCGNGVLKRLSAVHFLLHGCVHYSKDLDGGSASLKGLVDLLRLLLRHGAELDARGFWTTADTWGILSEAAGVMATLQEQWGLAVPGIPPEARPLPIAVQVDGWDDAGRRGAERQFTAYVEMVRAARELPNLSARIRVLSSLLFPAPEKLRHSYGLQAGEPLLPHYVRHPFRVTGRVLRGMLAARGRQPRSRSARN